MKTKKKSVKKETPKPKTNKKLEQALIEAERKQHNRSLIEAAIKKGRLVVIS